jgi:methionyl-tRNA formyltransferase
MKKKLGMIEE